MVTYPRQMIAATVASAALLSIVIAVPAKANLSSVAVTADLIEISSAENDHALLASDTATTADDQDKTDKPKPAGKTFSGNVSWYGIQFHGKKTASGRMFDMNKLTCAHRTLPFGTKILVENPRTGQSVIVEVIDRGPYSGHRVMDLSREAARRLGILLGGLAFVQCTVIPNR